MAVRSLCVYKLIKGGEILKKLFVILTIALLFGISGCANKDNENKGSDKGINITREKFDKVEEMKDRLQGNYTGIFKVNNLEKGKYKVTILKEEYNNGKLKESRDLIGNEIEIKDEKDKLYVGVNKNQYDITVDINQINGDKINSSTTSSDINIGDDKENGYSWSMLEDNDVKFHKMNLDKEISIASFSIGNNDTTYGISVGEDTKKPNEYDFDGGANSKDIVIYLKISEMK
jgi:hypothetical protein